MEPIKPRTIVLLLSTKCHRAGFIMFIIAGGILLAILVLILLSWLLAGAAWISGISIVVAAAAGAVWAFWAGAQSSSGLTVELMIGAALVVWLLSRLPLRPSGQPNFAVRFLREWVRFVSAPVLAPLEYWQSIKDRRFRGERANLVAVALGLTWSCFVGVFLSWLAISLPALAVWGVLSSVWAK
jgi:hypothetical protein